MSVGELRERAATLRQGDWSDGPDDAALMDGAADEIERLWELVALLVRATHPADRAELILNAAELGVEVDG